jgi:hypothetical protein
VYGTGAALDLGSFFKEEILNSDHFKELTSLSNLSNSFLSYIFSFICKIQA